MSNIISFRGRAQEFVTPPSIAIFPCFEGPPDSWNVQELISNRLLETAISKEEALRIGLQWVSEHMADLHVTHAAWRDDDEPIPF